MPTLHQSLAIGPLGVTLSQLFMLVAFGVALVSAALLSRRQLAAVADSLIHTLLLGMIGARVTFVVQYHDSYANVLQVLDCSIPTAS